MPIQNESTMKLNLMQPHDLAPARSFAAPQSSATGARFAARLIKVGHSSASHASLRKGVENVAASLSREEIKKAFTTSVQQVSRESDYPAEMREPRTGSTRFDSLIFRVTPNLVEVPQSRQEQPIAIYGLSDSQQSLVRFCREELQMKNIFTIGGYNQALGIVNDTEGLEKLARHIADATEGKLAERISEHASSRLDHLKDWADYLCKNCDRLDAIAHLNTLLDGRSQRERMVITKQFVLKNSGKCFGITEDDFANELLNLIDRACKNIKDIIPLLRYDGNKYAHRDWLIKSKVYDISRHHFFRNSSKLGLRFFANHGMEIAFAWIDDESAKLDMQEIQDKPWKSGQPRFTFKHEPITYSEARSIIRKPALFDGKASKIYLSKNHVELGGPLTSEDWAQLPRPGLRAAIIGQPFKRPNKEAQQAFTGTL
jgi:hypothetical protein